MSSCCSLYVPFLVFAEVPSRFAARFFWLNCLAYIFCLFISHIGDFFRCVVDVCLGYNMSGVEYGCGVSEALGNLG